MTKLSHQVVVNLGENKKLTESLGRGSGALLFWRERGKVQCYFRYWRGKKPILILLGTYKEKQRSHGVSLQECRDKAFELARTRREIEPRDLKEHLALESQKAKVAHDAEIRQREAESRHGTFDDLLQNYISQLKKDGKESVAKVEQTFNKDVYKAHPSLLRKKAREITPDDIVDILAPIHQRNARVQSNRCRASLHAAFQVGAAADYDPARRGEKRFHLAGNPVSLVKKDSTAEGADDRILAYDELRDFYLYIEGINKVGPILASLARLMIATGGQRPKRLIHARWSDYDFMRRTLTLVEKKGTGGIRKHVIPLTARAIRIIRYVQAHNGDLDGPFYTEKGRPVRLDSLKNVFDRWHEHRCEEARQAGITEPEKFTARDIRRTANYLLTDAGVRPEDSNLLQSHGHTGVVVKHYDRHHHLPTKRFAIRLYEKVLSRVIKNKMRIMQDLNVDWSYQYLNHAYSLADTLPATRHK
ncbi:tyrosine-type recombinase/integrase [Parendozoicomonas haliclonae]|uniref:Phage integrase family protein n=1 Tax=Parendozoicomonas haliclonae TaxID=1960125 RepID=A0A1X7AJC6_9GAMM|nr:tyrosine-type recombinase/integrase [Parendozoicomonas haliclonae]SMA45595.1 Phage integrase family protein [Parendozoicomonas haliclonae]